MIRASPSPQRFELASDVTLALPPTVLQNDDAMVLETAELLGLREGWVDPGRRGQYEASWSWLLDGPPPDRYRGLTQPCLVAAFELDLLFPPRVGREAAAEIPRGEFVEIPGTTHGGLFDAAEMINGVVLEFFARH